MRILIKRPKLAFGPPFKLGQPRADRKGMLHVKQIREIIDAGQATEAHDALDQLLALGPQNTEALKLRAQLLEAEGRFAQEAKIWDKIATVDREDPDAVSYLLRRQVEDREHFYFTDDVPGGGRRFMAYPRALINNSALGLIGCIAFLLSTRLSVRFPIFSEPTVMLCLFGFFVMLPWLSIVIVYFRAIRYLTISTQSITVSTRVKTRTFRWSDLDKICLASSMSAKGSSLTLVIVPKDTAIKTVEIDLNQGSSAIRARSYLVREITRYFSEPVHARRDSLGLEQKKIASY